MASKKINSDWIDRCFKIWLWAYIPLAVVIFAYIAYLTFNPPIQSPDHNNVVLSLALSLTVICAFVSGVLAAIITFIERIFSHNTNQE